MASQMGFFFDQRLCIGCKACVTSCMVHNQLDPGVAWRRVTDHEVEARGRVVARHWSTACHHCARPACLTACTARAYSKRADGLVVHDRARCKGCGDCVQACPYHVPVVNAATRKAEKCDGCAPLVDRGAPPACVRGCPVQVHHFTELSALGAADAELLAVGFADLGTGPSIRFVKAQGV
jgi:Fe-S-cluster-containing dehydrogenase component